MKIQRLGLRKAHPGSPAGRQLPQEGSNFPLAPQHHSSALRGGGPRSGGWGLAATLLAGVIATTASAEPDTKVSEVIVTATRLPTLRDVTPGAYIVSAKEIEQRQAVFAADVLDTVPGLSVFSAGAFGGITAVRQRGASSDKSLVLIDGVPLNDASQPAGGFDFSAIDMADISRVEVLNGPQSSVWGSDAIGGVIAFTTRAPNGVRLDLSGGSYGTGQISGSIGRSTDLWAIGIAGSSFSSTGISSADARNGNSEPDGTRQMTASLRGRLTVNAMVTVDGQVRINQSRTAIDGFPPPFFLQLADTNDVAASRSLDAYLHARIDGPLGLHSDLSFDRYVITRGDSGESGDFGYSATRDVYRWTSAHGGVDDTFSFLVGAERQDAHASLSDGSIHNLGASSAFVVGQWRPIARLTASASLRYDDPDVYRGQTTARAGAGYDLGGGFSLAASWGQGFKTPTISQTACDFCFTPPTPSLAPERADGGDLGLVWHSPDRRFSARVTAFSLNVHDEIAYTSGHYVNLAQTRSRGAEAEVEGDLGSGFRLQAAYTHDEAVNLTSGKPELRVPRDMASGAIFWRRGPANAALTVRTESSQLDTALDGFDLTERPGFTVANLAGGYDVNDHVTLTARIENLANTHYEESFGYGEPGRGIYVGVRLKN